MLWGQQIKCLYRPLIPHKKRSSLDIRQSNLLKDTLKEICPQDHLCKKGYMTQLQKENHTGFMIQVNQTSEYNNAMHETSTKEKASQRWPMNSKNLSCYNEAAQENPGDTNTIQMNQVFANHSKEDKKYPFNME